MALAPALSRGAGLAVVNGSDCGECQTVGVGYKACERVADRIVDIERCAGSRHGELEAVDLTWMWACAIETLSTIVFG